MDPSERGDFKKPVLVGKLGKLPRKVPEKVETPPSDEKSSIDNNAVEVTDDNLASGSNAYLKIAKKNLSPAELLKEQSLPLPYREPKWSGLPPPESGYKFEVLKSGMIVETIDVSEKPFHVFGRLAGCDILMAHPTISRYHAVLQYKSHATEDGKPCGFYLYDLGSSHGTVVNKIKLKPYQYVRVRVGHVIKLGCSTRLFILHGPESDREEESELTITEMKQQRLARKQQMELDMINAKIQKEQEEKEQQKKREEEGISWGMADDADEESDLSENPYAQPNNEELYLDDPKKTLRGYFEREGYTLEYDCQERGIGQFMCRVELPMEDARGKPVVAEVIHKGKKKDAVIQCALEACRIIDRYGLLRQAKHESRKRKMKNWKDDDYYDSDDDTFLDRTGSVEKKREKRMKEFNQSDDVIEASKSTDNANKAMTFNELVEKCKKLQSEINNSESKLQKLREMGKSTMPQSDDTEGDILDQFMNNLGKHDQSIANKANISKIKMEIQKLKQELLVTEKLAQIAKPANLPELIKVNDAPDNISEEPSKSAVVKKTGDSIFIGKKISKFSKKNFKHVNESNASNEDINFEVEVESDDEKDDVIEKNSENDHIDKNTPPCVESKSVSPMASKANRHKKQQKHAETTDKKLFGPMRPPSNYVIPDNYYNEANDRDLPEIEEPENEY